MKSAKEKLSFNEFEWTPQMSVCENTIDQQHQILLHQINKLTSKISSDSDFSNKIEVGEVQGILNFLYKYIKEHLDYEEKYMLKNKYPKFKQHKKSHDKFINFFSSFQKKFQKELYSPPKPGESVSAKMKELTRPCKKFLGDWWVNHILKVDQDYAKFMGCKKEGITGLEVKKLTKDESKTKGHQPPKLPKPKTTFNMAAIKADIERELKGGKIQEHHAQILEQRAPVEGLVEKSNKKVKAGKKDVQERQYIQTGVPGFDDLFEHGIPKGNAVLVAGGAGSGKTIFCLQTLFNHLAKGGKCFYMSFEESEDRLIRHMEEFGWDPKKYIKAGKFKVKRMSPFEVTRNVDALLAQEKGELLIKVDPVILPKGFNPDIIALDSLTAIASAFTGKEDSYRIYIEQLFRFFENIGSTAFLITETKQIPEIFSTTGVEEFLADGVIVFYNIKRGDVRENAIEVLKMRSSKHQKKIVAMQISDEGITVYPEQEIFGGLGNE
ncbi:MAG: bacteriohemerythrin [Candidatus Woesearchaeota archaeon]